MIPQTTPMDSSLPMPNISAKFQRQKSQPTGQQIQVG